MKAVSKWLLSLAGWTVVADVSPETQRCVVIAAPHTSNWDLWYALLAFWVMGIPLRFAIKEEWTRFPFGVIIKRLGGLGINRRPRVPGEARPSYVDAMAELFTQHQVLAVMVPPEGTRARRDTWKTGFYYIALKAGVPICLGYLDYKKKQAGLGPMLHPTGDIEKDMRKIMDFYRDIAPLYPDKFALDKRYA